MNSLFIVAVSMLALAMGYRFYGGKIASLWAIDAKRPTPAFSHYDGVDFVPSQNWFVLFSHHFASIAGAGPIIGPTLAVCLWGWLPALLWVVLGSIFFGGIHDFGSLIISVQEEGASIGDVAARAISQKAKIILSVFTWLALILVIAVFAYFGANTFVSQPQIIIPSLGAIPLAMVVGWALYRLKMNTILVTGLGLLSLGFLIFLGTKVSLPFLGTQNLWVTVLLIYCFFASIVPVNYLLQPRDYLCSFLLLGGLALAVAGVVLSRPELTAPMFTSPQSPQGFLWPMMFITVACGANSGFHSLVASGTTSKQLANEQHAQRIGFGGMLLEGFLAVLVIILVAGGFSAVDFQHHVDAQTNPVNLFGLGFGNVTTPILGPWGNFIALTILNIFILTTLDTATRITRYLTEELLHIKNRLLSTSLVVALGTWLALGEDSAHNPLWKKIWPAFGASNQLVAALALLVISCWLLSRKKPVVYSLVPAIFMLLTSVVALIFQMEEYLKVRDYVLLAVSALLIAAAGYLTMEALQVFKKFVPLPWRSASTTF